VTFTVETCGVCARVLMSKAKKVRARAKAKRLILVTARDSSEKAEREAGVDVRAAGG
jgi:hypothetical protein